MISLLLSVFLPLGEKDSLPGSQSNVFPFLPDIKNFQTSQYHLPVELNVALSFVKTASASQGHF